MKSGDQVMLLRVPMFRESKAPLPPETPGTIQRVDPKDGALFIAHEDRAFTGWYEPGWVEALAPEPTFEQGEIIKVRGSKGRYRVHSSGRYAISVLDYVVVDDNKTSWVKIADWEPRFKDGDLVVYEGKLFKVSGGFREYYLTDYSLTGVGNNRTLFADEEELCPAAPAPQFRHGDRVTVCGEPGKYYVTGYSYATGAYKLRPEIGSRTITESVPASSVAAAPGWRFRAPADKIDIERIAREAEEAGLSAVSAEIGSADRVMVMVRTGSWAHTAVVDAQLAGITPNWLGAPDPGGRLRAQIKAFDRASFKTPQSVVKVEGL